jgi:hypothetical protein
VGALTAAADAAGLDGAEVKEEISILSWHVKQLSDRRAAGVQAVANGTGRLIGDSMEERHERGSLR